MNRNNRRLKLAIMTNIIAPAKLPVYSGLAAHFDLLILHGGTESNRDSWCGVEKNLPNARVVKAWGWQIRTARKENGKIFDQRYLHVTPGYAWHLLRFRPDVIISSEMGVRTLIALAYGALFSRPTWVWWGGTLHTERKIGFAKQHLRKLISCWVTHWISYGQSSSEYLFSLGIGSPRILQIQNGVDERRFAANSTPEFQLEPRPVLLYVGQFIARKGVELLLNAAANLQKEGREFSLLLVGNGHDRQSLEQLTLDLQLRNVHFRPALPPERMPSIYRSADILIFPTLEDVWGLVVNEAILSGLTVLCSKYAGCAHELFLPGNIFDPHDADEFTRKLRNAACGQLPKSDPSRLMTTPQIVDHLVDALESSIGKRAGPYLPRREEDPVNHRDETERWESAGGRLKSS
jgi:glycosyltransferase involved in cell wall biosynthesis